MLQDVDFNSILRSSIVSFLVQYFQKLSDQVKINDGKNKWMKFLIKDDNLLKDIKISELKSIIVLKKNLTADPINTF